MIEISFNICFKALLVFRFRPAFFMVSINVLNLLSRFAKEIPRTAGPSGKVSDRWENSITKETGEKSS